MKNLNFFSLLFMAGMLLFVAGCQREEDHWVSNDKVAQITKHYLFKKTVDLDTMYDIKRHLQKFLKKSGGRNVGWDESNVLLNNAEYIQINEESSTTTIEISHQIPNKIYNLVINKVGETFFDPFVVEYHLHTDFVVGYASGNLTMQNFKGVLSTYPIEDFFGNSGRSSFDCQKAKACMDLYLNFLEGQQGNGDGNGGSNDGGYTQGGDGGSGGNGSGEGEGEGEGTGTGNTGSGWNGTGWITGEGTTGSGGTSGSGSGGDPGPGSDGGGTGDDGSTECEEGEEPVQIESIARTLCILDPSNQTFKGNDSSGSRNDELKKCSKMLNVLGFVNNTGVVADPEKTCIENCRQEYPEVAEAIEALDDLEILNPCTGDNIELDKSDIESELCMTGNYNLESLDKLIDKKLEELLGLGSSLDQNDPPLSSSNKLCPNSIIVTASEWEPNRQNVAGISNLQISLNNGVNLSFQNLFFKVDHTRDCGISTEQLIADAINNAMQIANDNITKGKPIFGNGLNNNIQFTRLVEEQMKSIANNLGCKPKANPDNNQTTNVPPFAAQAIPSSYGNATIGSEHCGARFVQFSAMLTGC